MDKIDFALLIRKMSEVAKDGQVTRWDIGDIATLIDESFEKIKSSSEFRPAQSDIATAIEVILINAFSGRKIEAIKEFRRITGFGLKESKDAIERGMAYKPEILQSIGQARVGASY